MSATASASAKMSASSFSSALASLLASADGEGYHNDAGAPRTRGADPVMVSGLSDGEQDHTKASGGKRTTSASGVNVVAEGDVESIILGDCVGLNDKNTDLQGLDIVAASVDTNTG